MADDEGGNAGDAPADDARPRREMPDLSRPLSVVNDGAGWVLGLLVWGWVALPFIQGGPAGVKNVLMAKFFNKAPDGSWLP